MKGYLMSKQTGKFSRTKTKQSAPPPEILYEWIGDVVLESSHTASPSGVMGKVRKMTGLKEDKFNEKYPEAWQHFWKSKHNADCAAEAYCSLVTRKLLAKLGYNRTISPEEKERILAFAEKVSPPNWNVYGESFLIRKPGVLNIFLRINDDVEEDPLAAAFVQNYYKMNGLTTVDLVMQPVVSTARNDWGRIRENILHELAHLAHWRWVVRRYHLNRYDYCSFIPAITAGNRVPGTTEITTDIFIVKKRNDKNFAEHGKMFEHFFKIMKRRAKDIDI
jgi:hypothetical protein